LGGFAQSSRQFALQSALVFEVAGLDAAQMIANVGLQLTGSASDFDGHILRQYAGSGPRQAGQ
ncbi:MAG: hypothetical protein RBS22_11940, partial [Spongiibacteraceae bacterium]|nr:hypothetical protein [Spongiibacteraceae bacterium]